MAHHGSWPSVVLAGMSQLHSALLPSNAIGWVMAIRLTNISTSSQVSLAVALSRTVAW